MAVNLLNPTPDQHHADKVKTKANKSRGIRKRIESFDFGHDLRNPKKNPNSRRGE